MLAPTLATAPDGPTAITAAPRLAASGYPRRFWRGNGLTVLSGAFRPAIIGRPIIHGFLALRRISKARRKRAPATSAPITFSIFLLVSLRSTGSSPLRFFGLEPCAGGLASWLLRTRWFMRPAVWLMAE